MDRDIGLSYVKSKMDVNILLFFVACGQLESGMVKKEARMKDNDIEAIIFDVDGLMFGTERLYEEAFAMIAKKWGYEAEVSEAFIKDCKGKRKEDIKVLFKSLLDGISLEKERKEFDFDEYLKQLLDYLDEAIETRGLPVKDGLIELLQYARENRIKIAIGTSEKSPRIQSYLQKANITADSFDAIICGDMVQNGKPAPDIFLKACEALSVNPEKTMVLEDAPSGIIAAYRAGAKPVMVIDCIEPTDEIRNMLFTEPFHSLTEVQEMLVMKKGEVERPDGDPDH